MIGYDLLHVNHKQSRAKKDGSDEQTERLPDIAADTDGLACDFLWREGFILIDTGVQGIRVCVGHLPEGVFDDAGGVIAHAQFKKNDFLVLLGVQEGFVAVCGGVSALVLDEFVIGEQVQRCGFAAVRAGGKELGGDAHGFLPAHHFADDRFVVPCFLTARFGALEQAVVALCVETGAVYQNPPSGSSGRRLW